MLVSSLRALNPSSSHSLSLGISILADDPYATPSNLLKRRLPRFHYEDEEDEPHAGKKARTPSDMDLHFQVHEYKVPPQKKKVEFSRSKKMKLEVDRKSVV